MALSKSSLKDRIVAEFINIGWTNAGPFAELDNFAQALSNAIIDEITINARCSGVDSNSDTHDSVQIV